jgi:NAD+-processing family protein with receiver domain
MSDEIRDGTSSMRFSISARWNVLMLDDDLDRHAWFKQRMPDALFAETAEQAIQLLAAHKFNAAFLDHDLHWMHIADIGIFKGTGREVAKFMQDTDFKGSVVIHSKNPIGADLMCEFLPHAHIAPFGTFEII